MAMAWNLRWNCVFLLLVLTLVLPQHLATAAETEPPEVAVLEQRILTARRVIRSGCFLQDSFKERLDIGVQAKLRITTWISNEGWKREDVVNVVKGDVSRFAVGPDWAIKHSYNPALLTASNLAHWPVLEMRPRDSIKDNERGFQGRNPLIVMLYPGDLGSSMSFHAESVVNAPERRDFVVTPERWRDRDATRVAFFHGGLKSKVEYIVVPDVGYNIVWMKQQYARQNGVESVSEVEADVVRVKDDIWYPGKLRFAYTLEGKLVERQEVVLEVSHINEGLDVRLFELRGLDVLPGTLVAQNQEKGRDSLLKWDGTQLSPYTQRDRAERMIVKPTATEASWRRVLLWASAGCALAGACAWWIWERLRRKRRLA